MSYTNRNQEAATPTEPGWYWFQGYALSDPEIRLAIPLKLVVQMRLDWRAAGDSTEGWLLLPAGISDESFEAVKRQFGEFARKAGRAVFLLRPDTRRRLVVLEDDGGRAWCEAADLVGLWSGPLPFDAPWETVDE